MKTFIRAVETWVPNKDRSSLEFGGGLYRNVPGFRAASPLLRLARGEGLPGQAWDRGLPVVMTPLDGISSFRRGAAAREAGLTSGIAIPVFAGDFLTSVLVLLCGDDDVHAGAIELWRAIPDLSPDMKLLDAYYGTTGEAFESSRHAAFRRGVGLPGMVWESGLPVFIEDLGKSDRFLCATPPPGSASAAAWPSPVPPAATTSAC